MSSTLQPLPEQKSDQPPQHSQVAQIDQPQLQLAVRRAELAVKARAANPALGCVHISSHSKGVAVHCSDGRFHMLQILPCKKADGIDALIPLTTLKKAVAAFGKDDQLQLSSVDRSLLLVRGSRELKINGRPYSQRLPVWPASEHKPKKVISFISSEELGRAFSSALISASKDASRPVLNTVLVDLEERALLSTDSYRLCKVPLPKPQGSPRSKQKFLLPHSMVRSLSKELAREDLPVSFESYENGLLIKQGDLQISGHLVEGNFPDWQKLFADNKFKSELVLNRSQLEEALQAVAALAGTTDGEQPTIFDLSSQVQLHFHAADGNQLTEDLNNCQYNGDPLRIAFHHSYLLDMLKIIPEFNVSAELNGDQKPALFKSELGHQLLLMPIRTRELPPLQ